MDDDIRKEVIDYIVKKLKKLILEPESLVAKDLDQFSLRIEKQEERLAKIIERIESLENRVRNLERENSSESSSSSK